ncbi:hypothetical protein [Pseudonocardia sp. WMMC193]|uniref:hypothetical protein n=1 Tax=Pseudonocardia sp. WMMC193 TaxID=2911965 RepID=UPI001F29EA66|nr:hypothetical protein [Pseudonocardia sp. WMMC193]MCF7548927.1 hypothetical protein [Pseudonocardia sp. WMMC193]
MPHSAVHEVLETIPAHTHAVWCRAHEEESDYDQTCRTQPVKFQSTTTSGMPLGHIGAVVEQSSVFDALSGPPDAWDIRPAQIELTTYHRSGNEDGHVWLTPGMARRLAAALIDLADLADDETGRAAR